jgi:hypothetical protein
MSSEMGDVSGTKRNPWVLKTSAGSVQFTAYRDAGSDPPAIVVNAAETELRFHLRSLNDLDEALKEHEAWMLLGSTDEKHAAAAGTVEAWARSPENPLTGWYGLTKGARGRFADFIPPIMVVLDLAEIEDGPGGIRMRSR